MSKEPVRIVNYNPSWPEDYLKYAKEIAKTIGNFIDKVAHVGSTSIVGLGAKPIIDISITAKDVDDPNIMKGMLGLGYQYVDKDENSLPFRRYFVLKDAQTDLVHVHIVPINHKFHQDHIIFRDYLRKYRDIRDEYHLLKTRLANKYKHDRRGYQEAKTDFVQRMIELAKEEMLTEVKTQ